MSAEQTRGSEPALDSMHLPDRPRQCFVLVRPILLLAQHGNPLLAFLLRSNIAHDAIHSDGVAALVEAFDYDCSLACFHGDKMHFDSLTFAFLTARKTHAELTRMVIRVTDGDGGSRALLRLLSFQL